MPRLSDAEKAAIRLLMAASDYSHAVNPQGVSKAVYRLFARDFGSLDREMHFHDVAKRYRRLRDHRRARVDAVRRQPVDPVAATEGR